MIRSLQNIALGTVVVSALALSGSTAASIITCPSSENCTAAVTFYKMTYEDFKVKQSTQALPSPKSDYSFEEVAKATKVVSTYSLIGAIIVMIALEAFELRYLKMFLSSKKRRATVSRR